MAEILELPELSQSHRVADVDAWAGGVEALFDAEGPSSLGGPLQLLQQLLRRDYLLSPPQQELELFAMGMGVVGGLALFLFGMGQMAGALKAIAGERLKGILARLTTNRIAGVLTGALVTGIIQSSSVTTVLTVGFITAGVLSSGVRSSDQITLFIDVGTNGELVLGSSGWLVTCACSAGPAFEGSGVVHGMRADRGAIEEVWIDGADHEPTYRVIGNSAPRGICGSGLISLISEMFLTGILDKRGHFDRSLPTDRVRRGESFQSPLL